MAECLSKQSFAQGLPWHNGARPNGLEQVLKIEW
jgi:hypothetical protein